MLDLLFIVIGVELTLLASIAAMTLHGRRTDVLSGRYFSREGYWTALPGRSVARLPPPEADHGSAGGPGRLSHEPDVLGAAPDRRPLAGHVAGWS
jgi:hypothetical protein